MIYAGSVFPERGGRDAQATSLRPYDVYETRRLTKLSGKITEAQAVESTRDILRRPSWPRKKTFGNSYDVDEKNRLKKRHVGNSYDVDENTGSCAPHPTMLLKTMLVKFRCALAKNAPLPSFPPRRELRLPILAYARRRKRVPAGTTDVSSDGGSAQRGLRTTALRMMEASSDAGRKQRGFQTVEVSNGCRSGTSPLPPGLSRSRPRAEAVY